MPFRRDNIEIKPLADFISLIENNQTYTGLVESVGYVYWETETLWFEHINSDNRWVIPIYHRINFFPANRRNPVLSKIFYTLQVMSPDELKQHDIDMYYAYYGHIFEMPGMPVDALRVHRVEPIFSPMRHSGGSNGQAGSNELFRIGAGVDDAIGAPLGMAEILSGNRNLGRAGGALAGLSILNDLDRGEYWSAGGKTLLFAITQISSRANIYAGFINFGIWVYETDYMQRQLAIDYAKEYKYYEYLYRLELERRNPNQSRLNQYGDKMELNKELFR